MRTIFIRTLDRTFIITNYLPNYTEVFTLLRDRDRDVTHCFLLCPSHSLYRSQSLSYAVWFSHKFDLTFLMHWLTVIMSNMFFIGYKRITIISPFLDLINLLLLVLITDLIIFWNHNNLLIISCLETEITNWNKGAVSMETVLSKLIGVLIRAGETTNLCEAENTLIAYCD